MRKCPSEVCRFGSSFPCRLSHRVVDVNLVYKVPAVTVAMTAATVDARMVGEDPTGYVIAPALVGRNFERATLVK